MKKIVLYSPGHSSMNIGDKIISESAKRQLEFLLKKSFQIDIATHLPQSFYYMRHLRNSDYRFVLGSNLLKSTFFGFKRQWDITLRSSLYSKPCILVGAGWWQYNNKPNFYTKLLLKLTLDSKYIHSVRDEYTVSVLKSIGINNVINTSCPTMWGLTREHCNQIPTNKSSSVVFTLTDYNKDIFNDRYLVDTLVRNYDKVYYWPQGIGDYNYFTTHFSDFNDNVISLNPTLEAFDNILDSGNIDFIGTRLHGGIRALQKKVRTIIIAIDNRAIEKNKSFNLPIINRDNLSELEMKINSKVITEVNIPLENISIWKKQFVDKELI